MRRYCYEVYLCERGTGTAYQISGQVVFEYSPEGLEQACRRARRLLQPKGRRKRPIPQAHPTIAARWTGFAYDGFPAEAGMELVELTD